METVKASDSNDIAKIERGVSKSESIEPLGPTAVQIKDMRHMLGMTGSARKGEWGYRNHYAASHGDAKVLASMAQLVEMGLVEEGAATLTLQYFHCTRKGCEVAGLSKAGIKRVFGA